MGNSFRHHRHLSNTEPARKVPVLEIADRVHISQWPEWTCLPPPSSASCKVVERKQMKDFMNMYANLVQRCFTDCVTDFTSKSLLGKEEGCVMRCVDKFLKSSERLGERFQEQNAAMAQQGSMPGR